MSSTIDDELEKIIGLERTPRGQIVLKNYEDLQSDWQFTIQAIKDLIASEVDKARIDELNHFLVELDKQDPYIPLDGTPRQYVYTKYQDRIAELKEQQ
jgi:hypothetical protein